MKAAAISLGGTVAAAVAAGPFFAVGIGFVILVLIGAICWVLNNGNRTDRLAKLIVAVRSSGDSPRATVRGRGSLPA